MRYFVLYFFDEKRRLSQHFNEIHRACIYDNDYTILIYKKLSKWAEEYMKVQEHDKCV
jgi:hypothetical protein